MPIEIKSRFTERVLYTSEKETIKEALEEAVAAKVDLYGASLDGARLDGASLGTIKNDFFEVLLNASHEAAGLRQLLIEGKVNGTCYESACNLGCLLGSIAYLRGVKYTELEGITPNGSRPIERFFLGITKGSTPENNQLAAIAVNWIDEFTAKLEAAKAAV